MSAPKRRRTNCRCPDFWQVKSRMISRRAPDAPIKSISRSVGRKSAEFICSIIAFILVFFIVVAIMTILKSILKLATKLPVLKQADAVGGVLIGFAEGVVFLCVLALLLSVFSSRTEHAGHRFRRGKVPYCKIYLRKQFYR